MSLYENVKKQCEAHNISVLQLESQLGFARSSICKWDTNVPSVDRVQKVANFLNVPITEILDKE